MALGFCSRCVLAESYHFYLDLFLLNYILLKIKAENKQVEKENQKNFY